MAALTVDPIRHAGAFRIVVAAGRADITHPPVRSTDLLRPPIPA